MDTPTLVISDVTETLHKRKRVIQVEGYTVNYVKTVENGVVVEQVVTLRDGGRQQDVASFDTHVAKAIGNALIRVQDESEYGDNRSDW